MKIEVTLNNISKSKLTRPLSQSLFALLRQRIADNYYTASGRIPAELSLMKEFGISRHTVRAALQRLVMDGLITRNRGGGTTIVKHDVSPTVWAVASLDQVMGNIDASNLSDLLFADTVPARDTPDIAKLFRTEPDGLLFKIVVLLKSEDRPIAYSTIFTRVEHGKAIPKDLIVKEYIVRLLERYCGVRVAHARQIASAAVPTDEAREALGLARFNPILQLERIFRTRSGDPVQHVLMQCRWDASSQIVDFSREDGNI